MNFLRTSEGVIPPFALGVDVDRSSVSRAEAVERGELVPVGRALARDAGFIVPVALTAAAHADCVAWSN
ncbi:hypothetical protein [Streptomyces johnsoniae]|uniref:Uncharacterized protein n=1 Tax=Streptomyces johnsoniae TaxID=3075532 RepID=A0ABU2SCV6_9ACTN|nr:hypothetical protein [Streptomyces sp. DSM 41886]MDT0446801.1 hypothetical protein [Streptomyces sp. DSM 41886]